MTESLVVGRRDVSGVLKTSLVARSGDEVHVGRSGTTLVAAPETVEDHQAGEEPDGEVGSDKGRRIESVRLDVNEYTETVEEQDDAGEDQTVPGEEDSDRSAVREESSVDTLSLESGSEADVGDKDTTPSNQTTDRSHVCEVTEYGTSGFRTSRHERQKTESYTHENASPWETPSVGLLEEGGSLTVYGETVKGTGRSVEIGRSGGPG